MNRPVRDGGGIAYREQQHKESGLVGRILCAGA